jgi:hypothetical protein
MLLSARMFGCFRVERGDDGVEVSEHLSVHFGEAVLAAGFGGGDQLKGLLALSSVLRQEFGVVKNMGQVRQALAWGQLCWTGRPQ